MNLFKRHSLLGASLALLLIQGCAFNQPSSTPPLTKIEPAIITPAIIHGFIVEDEHIIPTQPVQKQSVDDSWQYMVSLFNIPEVNNPRIEKEVTKILAHPEYIKAIQLRAKPYLYNIIEEVKKKGLPGELALLPAIESGYKAHAYSHSGAAGLWQFIPSTGKIYHLKQNWWYDGRRDIYASTNAATLYLQKLGKLFDNDWLLALASYNAGMGNVNRAIKRNTAKHRPTDYWHLNLPNETQSYVPKLLALAKVIAHAKEYGITLHTQEHTPAFSVVDIKSQLDLTTAARLSNLSLEELFTFNPGFNRAYTSPQGPHRLLIPIANVDLFKENLAKLPANQRIQWYRHKIKSGESLSTLAYRYKTQSKIIREVNHLKNNSIRAGKYLLIPVSKQTLAKNPFIQTNTLNTSHKYPRYIVKSGDSLWSIARKLDLHSKDIARWNRINIKKPLHLGQQLIIKQSTKIIRSFTRRPKTTQSIRYTVRSGDSLSTISHRFNVKITNLRKWNAAILGKYLKPGQTLTVKVNTTQPAT